LSERLAITPVPVETMIDQMGKKQGGVYPVSGSPG
jgi:hypothetical protein